MLSLRARRCFHVLHQRTGNGASLLLASRPLSATVHPVHALRPFSTTQNDDKQLIYEAPMARPVRLMKGVSVTSCILTSIGMPTLCMISEQSASMVGKWAMCGTVMLFGLGTTSLFHYLFKPYVIRMWIDVNKSHVTVETVTLFARLQQHSFALADVERPDKSMHPMLSFKVKSPENKHFFVHPECFEDRALAETLTGQKVVLPEEQQTESH